MTDEEYIIFLETALNRAMMLIYTGVSKNG